MSEKVTIAKHDLICDLCSRRIPKGSRCRIIRDDFMPGIVYFEHLRCPPPSATVEENIQPKSPVIHNNNMPVMRPA